MNSSSPVVCQIPDCMTTQAEIESELQSFLWGYCSICKKERVGRMCGCAYPCSLAFRGQMLQKIHELLGMEKPTERRAIQVCFKHPDLLKQAREACIAKNHAGSKIMSTCRRLTSFSGMGSLAPDRPEDVRKAPKAKGKDKHKSSEMSRTDRKSVESPVRSSVGGSAPQVKDARFPASSSRREETLRIRYGSSISFERKEDGREEVRIERLFVDDSDDHDEDEFEDLPAQAASSPERRSPPEEVQQHVSRTCADTLTGETEVIEEIDERELEEIERDLCDIASDSEGVDEMSHQEPSGREFKIRYDDYPEAVLFSGLRHMKKCNFLGDVRLVSSDGIEHFTNSLILGSMSAFLRDLLVDIPDDGDEKKTVILTDTHSEDLALFLRFLFDERSLKTVSPSEMKAILKISDIFHINALSDDNSSELLEDNILRPDDDIKEKNKPDRVGGRNRMSSNFQVAVKSTKKSRSGRISKEVVPGSDPDSSHEVVEDEFDVEEATESDVERRERLLIRSRRRKTDLASEPSGFVDNEGTKMHRGNNPKIRSSLKRSGASLNEPEDQWMTFDAEKRFSPKKSLCSASKSVAQKRNP